MGGNLARKGKGRKGFFFEKRTKRLLSVLRWDGTAVTLRMQVDEVFLLLFLQKKKTLACFLEGRRAQA
jgi:hypothetical protein